MTRASSRRAQASGDAFEQVLERHIFTPLQGAGVIARWDHLEPPMKRVRSTDGLRFVPTEKTGADYVLMLRGGLYCAAEAKSCDSDRFPRRNIKAHQERHLTETVNGGGLAFLLLHFRGQSVPWSCYWIPWAQVPWTTRRTAESLTTDDVRPWRVESWGDAKRILEREMGSR